MSVSVKENQSIILKKWNKEDENVFISDLVGADRLVKLEAYCFHNHRELKNIRLPKNLVTIGSHCFYDCRNLETIELWNTTTEIEDGAFKNCRSIKKIKLHIIAGKMTCLKNLLSELSQELIVELLYESREYAKLVFPRYLYDYVENTQARIINQVTHGMGVHYRECIMEQDIDYKSYDRIFKIVKATEPIQTVEQILLNRLMYPLHLSTEAKEEYMEFLDENIMAIVKRCGKNEWIKELQFLLQTEIGIKNKGLILKIMQEQQYMEGIALVLNQRNETKKKKKFDL